MSTVIQLKPKKEGELSPSLPIKKRSSNCLHKNIEIDEDEKELRCKLCNAVIYPFDYVLSLTFEERKLFWEFDEIRRKIKDLKEQKERLEKDVNNLKSAKRRLL